MDLCREDNGKVMIYAFRFKASIFDLDGVITQTAKVHASAWKETFDEYLRAHPGGQEKARPFDIRNDYTQYVDGKPRYDGVKSFLESRGIDLPFGSPEDPPEKETVCGLGNRKNQLFRQKIREKGVQAFPLAAGFIHQLRQIGKKTAVVSSSKNCPDILEAADLSELFDAKVDGNDLDSLELKGKPDPDIFLEAARRLGVEPRESIVFEDAISGIQAGRKGGFGCVIGVARKGNASVLRENGADAVILDFSQIVLDSSTAEKTAKIEQLPSALENLSEINARMKNKRPAFFLDYDGTLTPIVRRPELAVLSEEMRQTVRTASKKYFVAVISGRDLADVKKLVGLPSLGYAGSHGFDISGPEGKHLEYQKGGDFLPHLKKAERQLKSRIQSIEGAHVESKKFSFAVHFREVQAERAPEVEKAVDEVVSEFSGLRKSWGKKVFEIQPDLDWNKGKALIWLLESFDLAAADVLPFYLGDDITDEDAFKVLIDKGIGIVVGENGRPTFARYRLKNPEEVRLFLSQLESAAEGEM
jgi:trehalose 6-phosphate phosphatase